MIVGEAPSRTGNPRTPITGRCGETLARYSGLSGPEFRRRFARANVLRFWPGESGAKGAAFPTAEATLRAHAMRRRLRGRVVVMLGYRTAAAFRVRVRYFVPVAAFGGTVYVVPHPSGINRWYNDRGNRLKMRMFMRLVVMGVRP